MGQVVDVYTWGGLGTGKTLSGTTLRVRVTDTRSGLDAALAQLQRRTHQQASAVTPHGTTRVNGAPYKDIYLVTLGQPKQSEGVDVTGVIWIGVCLSPRAKAL